MKHLMGYVALAAAAVLLTAAPARLRALDLDAQPQAATVGAAAVRVAPNVHPAVGAVRGQPASTSGNLDPYRGPVVSNPHAYPHDAIGSPSGAPYHTWKGYSPN
jgi:hypothetical protein